MLFRRARALLVPLGLSLALLSGRSPAEEFIYLGAGPLLGDRARELRTSMTPPAGWVGPDFDDGAWPAPAPPAAPAVPDGGAAPACTGALYLRRRFDVGPE